MTVDKQLICFRGRCFFKQYIFLKLGKYKIKPVQFSTPLALTHGKCEFTLVKMMDRPEKLIKAQELFVI